MFRCVLTAAALVLFAGSTAAHAQKQTTGAPPEASNMKLVGTNDLQARSAYQPTIHHQGDRWIAYIGHHGGTDDVPAPINPMTGQAEPTAPRSSMSPIPRIPNTCFIFLVRTGTYESGGAQMVRVCDGRRAEGRSHAVYCCAPLAARRMKSGTSPFPQSRN